jgi:predicted nucleic acid-binding protein
VNLYLDTSSLLKVYLRHEEGREAVESLLRQAAGVYVSLVGYAEARAAMARAHRDHRLDLSTYQAIATAFEEDWQRNTPVDVSEVLVKLAGGLAEKHFLRGLDAIHLASALTLQRELGDSVTFSAADGRLMAAASVEGLLVAS